MRRKVPKCTSRILSPPLWLYCVIAFLIILILYVIHFYLYSSSNSIEPQKTQQHSIFKSNSSLPSSGYKVVAITDISRSKVASIIYADIFDSKLLIYDYSEKQDNYNLSQAIPIKFESSRKDDLISAVIPIDSRLTGFNDLLIIHSKEYQQPPFYSDLILNHYGQFSQDTEIIHNYIPPSLIFPYLFDTYNHGFADILYLDQSDKSLYVTQITDTSHPKFFKNFSTTDIYFASGQFTSLPKLSLLIKSDDYFQIFTPITQTTKKASFQDFDEIFEKSSPIFIPEGAGDPSVGDFNMDGNLDIVFPVINEKKPSYLCFFFNQGNGTFLNDKTCDGIGSLSLNIKNLISKAPSLGDINLNGRPDLLATIKASNGDKWSVLILNQPCQGCNQDLTFVEHSSIFGEGTFIDFKDSGHLGIVTDKGAYDSQLSSSSNYLKASSIAGVKFEPQKSNVKVPKTAPYYNHYIKSKKLPLVSSVQNGATMKIKYSEKGGKKHHSVAVQNVGVNPSAPYWIFGLGEKIHYIDEIEAINNETNRQTWLFPNSKVYLGHNGDQRVYLQYKIYEFPTLISTMILLFTLGFFVLKASKKEEEDDLKEAEEVLPMF